MGHLQSQSPMELVFIDFLWLEVDMKEQGNILVVTDHFTWQAQAIHEIERSTSFYCSQSPSEKVICPLWDTPEGFIEAKAETLKTNSSKRFAYAGVEEVTNH